MNKSTGIHCKVICDGQIRRFQFSCDEFPSLQKQVKQLLGLNREFSLKYKDNEGDMITLSSTEELSCAIEISQNENGGLLRLAVFFQTEPITETQQQPSNVHSDHHEYGGVHHHHYGNGNGGKWGHHGRGGPGHHHEFRNSFKNFDKPRCQFGGHENLNTWKGQKQCRFGSEPQCQNRFEKRKDKLMFKRDMFNAYLNSLEQNKEISPEDQRRKQIFLMKVQKIDSVLEQFYSTKKMDQPQIEKMCKKDVTEVQDQKKMDQPQIEKINQRDVTEIQDQKKMDQPQIEKTNSWNPRDVSEFQYPKKMDHPPFEKNCSRNQRDVNDFQYPKKYNCHNKNFEKKERKFEKFEKKERKFEKKRDCKEIKKEKKDFEKCEISEESKQEIILLKNQIKELKPQIWSIDDKMKTKKEETRKSFESGVLPENSFKTEIGKLKQEKRVIKEKINSIRQRIYQLKTGGK